MTELSHEETIRFENSKAHYHKIMGDVNDANHIISTLMSIKVDIETSIETLKEELSQLEKEKEESRHVLFLNTEEQNKFEVMRDGREGEVAAIERNHLVKVIDLVNQTSILVGKEKTLTENLNSLHSAIDNATEELNDLEHSISIAEGELEAVEDSLQNVHEDLSETTMIIDDTRAEFHKEMTAKNKELGDVKQQIVINQQLVDAPFRALQEEREAHAKRLKDYDVMYARMKRVYSELNPGKTLTI